MFANLLTPYQATFPINLSSTVSATVLEPNPAPIPLSPPSAYQLLQVTFTVTWTGITGHTYTRTSTTYVSQNGLYVAYQRS
jgi:hypothetical protein